MFSADVTVTQNITDDMGQPVSCTLDYHAVGLYPAIDCTAPVYKLGADGKPEVDMDGNPVVEKYQADPTLCSPDADPDNGRPTGSGINPDVKTKCVAFVPDAQFYCVLDGEPPAFK
jgi:hypothetical protein